MSQPGESICEGSAFPPPDQSRCALCHLPMENHPIRFVMPQDHPDPYIRKLGGRRRMPVSDMDTSDNGEQR